MHCVDKLDIFFIVPVDNRNKEVYQVVGRHVATLTKRDLPTYHKSESFLKLC